ncbi:unnamed protein product [Parnassius apollo]|uniref:(apollo) hypothetical protein n=1 Tax=Parnassius apollo TaxID=110799 RepID=A0A8S3Y3B9_PARAO|nr:unnamed protein product [Parnassius apollo]
MDWSTRARKARCMSARGVYVGARRACAKAGVRVHRVVARHMQCTAGSLTWRSARPWPGRRARGRGGVRRRAACACAGGWARVPSTRAARAVHGGVADLAQRTSMAWTTRARKRRCAPAGGRVC